MEKLIKVVNVETGEVIEREMNAQELAQFEADQELKIAREKAEAAKAAEKSVLLNRLGITADEAKLLLS